MGFSFERQMCTCVSGLALTWLCATADFRTTAGASHAPQAVDEIHILTVATHVDETVSNPRQKVLISHYPGFSLRRHGPAGDQLQSRAVLASIPMRPARVRGFSVHRPTSGAPCANPRIDAAQPR